MVPAETFVAYPQNEDFVRGRVRHYTPTPDMSSAFYLGALFSSFGLIILFFLYQEGMGYYLLNHVDGVEAQGKVTRRQLKRADDGAKSYRIFYSYRAAPPNDGIDYRRDESVSVATYEAYDVGAPIPVKYSKSRPDVARLQGAPWQAPLPLLGIAGFGLIWYGVCAVVMYSGWRSRTTSRRLKEQGRIVIGRITEMSGKVDHESDFVLRFKYEFSAPDGRLVQGQAFIARNDLEPGIRAKLKFSVTAPLISLTPLPGDLSSGRLPAVGTPVAVFAADSRHYQIL